LNNSVVLEFVLERHQVNAERAPDLHLSSHKILRRLSEKCRFPKTGQFARAFDSNEHRIDYRALLFLKLSLCIRSLAHVAWAGGIEDTPDT
jgi:hypothetical protein